MARPVRRRASTTAMVVAGLLVVGLSGPGATAATVADEIHFAYGGTPDQIVLDWRGDSGVVEYGLTDSYGSTVTASAPGVRPVDSPGPFWEAVLPVEPDRTYHYRIGGGADHVLRSQPTGDFRWADVGDTGTTLCTPWVATTHDQLAAAQPHVVTHGGDISYANDCGVPAVHQYYVDQEAWATSAAFQPVMGNHEYGAATTSAPPGTPRDSLANYKGRSFVTNGQAVPGDTPTKLSAPGCAPAPGTTTNGCRGEDWGWFDVSGVRYISYPEPWWGALPDWQSRADQLMAQAQADARIDFIVTYGHRPAYSSQTGNAAVPEVTAALDALGDRYSPAARADGKYVLNVAHHAHSEEAFSPRHGVVHLTNGGGGEGQNSFGSPAPGSVFRTVHPGYLIGDYSATSHQLDVSLRCGPAFTPNPKEPCSLGAALYSVRFGGSAPPPPPPPPPPLPGPTPYVANRSVEDPDGLTGWTGVTTATSVVTRTTGGYDGTYAVRVDTRATSAPWPEAGFQAKPALLVGGGSRAGVGYTATVQVRAGTAGQRINLLLRECPPGTSTGCLGSALASTASADTQWHELKVTYTSKASGNEIRFVVSAPALPGGQYALADLFSLTSP